MIPKILLRKETFQDLAAGALSYSYTFVNDGELDALLFHFSAACSQTLTVTFDSATGANYDTVLKSQALSGTTDFTYQPDRPIPFQKGDIIKIAITSGGTAVAYMTMFLQTIRTYVA